MCLCLLERAPVLCTSTEDCPDEEEDCAKVPSVANVCMSKDSIDSFGFEPVESNEEDDDDEKDDDEEKDGDEEKDDDDEEGDGDGNGNTDVCIAVASLRHVSSSELVFKEDRRAFVLCDDKNSCATPGHMA